MRLALLSDYPVDPSRMYGGVQAVAYHLAEGLARYQDLDLHVIHSSRTVSADSVSTQGRLTIHRIAAPRRAGMPNLIAAVFRCSRVLEALKPDLANAHTGQYALAAIRAGVPTIYTIHGIPHRLFPYVRGTKRRCAAALQMLFDRLAIKRVGDIIAISPYVETAYRNLTKARLHRADNFIPEKWFETVVREVRGRVLFAGTVAYHKGVHFLPRALSQLISTAPEAHLHVAGRLDDPRYLKRLRLLLDNQQLDSRVTFLGPLDGSAMQREYSECALLVLPSLCETAPLAVLEGMAAGRPVVGARVGGLPNLVEDGVTGFLTQPGDTNGLSECIGRLLRDSDLRTRMGRRGREVARARFRVDTVVARYRQIYDDVLKRYASVTRLDTEEPAMTRLED